MPDLRETLIPLNADHESICRFAREDDENYMHVSALIVDLASSATEVSREVSRTMIQSQAFHAQEAFSSTGSTFVESSLVPETPEKRFCKLFEIGNF